MKCGYPNIIDLLSRNEQIIELVRKEIGKCNELKEQFTGAGSQVSVSPHTLKIRNTGRILDEIYKICIRSVNLGDTSYPFISEVGINFQGKKISVDKDSGRLLEDIINHAAPYLEIIRMRDLGDSRYRQAPLFNKFDSFGGKMYDSPEEYIPEIKFEDGVFMLPVTPSLEWESQNHLHFYDSSRSLELILPSLFPSVTDMVDYKEPPRPSYKFIILYLPVDYNLIKTKKISAPPVSNNVAVGVRTQLNLPKKSITLQIISG